MTDIDTEEQKPTPPTPEERKRGKIFQRLDLGMSVWFKRRPYSSRGNYSTTPLWHRLEKIVTLERYDSGATAKETWQALCGYTVELRPWIDGMPDVQHQVKTAKIRCTKCTKLSERLITS
jgi:hypothetical protein